MDGGQVFFNEVDFPMGIQWKPCEIKSWRNPLAPILRYCQPWWFISESVFSVVVGYWKSFLE